MDRYYKCQRKGSTGTKFTEIIREEKEYEKKAIAFIEKYGFKSFRPGRAAFGYCGISACCTPVVGLNKKIWKSIGKDDYLPKENCKEGKVILEELNRLPEVNINELNNIVNYSGDRFCQSSIGFSFGVGSKEFYGFILNDRWNVKVPDDCIEITGGEYKELFN